MHFILDTFWHFIVTLNGTLAWFVNYTCLYFLPVFSLGYSWTRLEKFCNVFFHALLSAFLPFLLGTLDLLSFITLLGLSCSWSITMSVKLIIICRNLNKVLHKKNANNKEALCLLYLDCTKTDVSINKISRLNKIVLSRMLYICNAWS